MRTSVLAVSWLVIAATGVLTGGIARAQQPAPAVVVAPAKIMDLRETADLTGRVVAEQKVDIRARVSGFLEKIDFTDGQKVAAGALLYEVEDGSYRAAVQEIEGSIKAAEAARQLAQIERDRTAALVSRNTVARAQLDSAEAQLTKAEGDLLRLQGSKQRADLDLSYTRITAPFEGITGITTVNVGALVGPDSGPLVTLTRLDPINVEFPVATALYLQYRERERRGEVPSGANIQITLPDGTVYPQRGKINFVASNVAQGTDTLIVRANFPNPDGTLLDGALVRVTLEANTPQDVLAVPQEAVQRDQAGSFVMVVGADSKVELRRIDIARSTRGQAVVSKGLTAGELVITDGIGKVRPGMVVDAAQASGS